MGKRRREAPIGLTSRREREETKEEDDMSYTIRQTSRVSRGLARQAPKLSVRSRGGATRRVTVSAASADTLGKVQGIIAEQLGTDVEKIGADAKFVDLGADSLDTVEIMMPSRRSSTSLWTRRAPRTSPPCSRRLT